MAGGKGDLSRRALFALGGALGGAALVGASRPARGQGTDRAAPGPPRVGHPLSEDGNIREQVYELIAEQLDVEESELDDSKSFRDDLHADSLAMTELALAVEEKFDVKIPDSQIPRIKRVGQLVKYVRTHRPRD